MTEHRLPDLATFAWQPPVLSWLNDPPGTPAEGDRYLIDSAPTGVWIGHASQIAEWSGAAWEFTAPAAGMVVWDLDQEDLWRYSAAWELFPLHSQQHALVGGDHSASGLTPGHFLKATGETTFGFAAHGLSYTDVGAAAAAHDHTGVYEPIIAAGQASQYWRGDKTWQALNQAAVAGLGIADSPTFAGLTLAGNLTMDGYTLVNPAYVNIKAVAGYGIRFWASDSFKIHMGNTAEYQYGPVTDYSIKMNMNATAGRGWTWGVGGQTPVAALSNVGDLQIARNLVVGGFLNAAGDILPDDNLTYNLGKPGPSPLLWANIYAYTVWMTQVAGAFNLLDGVHMGVGATAGSKIGTAASQKLGFWGATPVVRPAHVADATGALANVVAQFNLLLTRLENCGILASS